MKYFFTNDTVESTKLLLTSQISEIAARKYPIAILYKKHDKNKKFKHYVNRRNGIYNLERKYVFYLQHT